jgi:hypothetical protein
MEILSALLCDSAEDYVGKLCVLGAFDSFASANFPVIHPQCAVAVRYLLRDEDVGQHTIRVLLVGPDGESLIPMPQVPTLNIRVEPLQENVFFASQNLVLKFQGLQLQGPGQCEVRVLVDGQIARTVPFQIIQLAQPSEG